MIFFITYLSFSGQIMKKVLHKPHFFDFMINFTSQIQDEEDRTGHRGTGPTVPFQPKGVYEI